ncbi:glycosyltransferase [Pedobacter sp. MC2016-14]|uniref:glycosyltransferase family 2 protein n=1 Tax=Pedobacter sp. MC2016-14 TaxID=2897327 RepID=UPI001E3FDAB1|nr:glycosyltransferase family 2 protein [Pedobacter sp. MC2016-14]MCD0486867.1 glycosyltransferase [Pedobacter sp. MC2016-14]
MEEKQPLVSIISGYYNRENYVDESILSLINQTYEHIEIIIFDDLSTDNTYEKLRVFEEKDSRVKVIRHEKNKGFVKGLIDAIAVSKGDYIAIHGSGDFSYPERINEQVEILNLHQGVGVVGCTIENLDLIKSGNSYSHSAKIEGKAFFGNAREILAKKNMFSHGEVMIRRKHYDMVGGYRDIYKFSQDYDLWCRMSFVCDFYIVPKLLYRRYILSDGASFVFNKVLIQRMLAEFIRQSQESRLTNPKADLVDRYGSQGFFFFEYTKVFFKNLYPAIINEFVSEVKSEDRKIVRHLISRTPTSIYTFLAYVYYFVLPKKVALSIINLRNKTK